MCGGQFNADCMCLLCVSMSQRPAALIIGYRHVNLHISDSYGWEVEMIKALWKCAFALHIQYLCLAIQMFYASFYF